jgi:hypothetical protein
VKGGAPIAHSTIPPGVVRKILVKDVGLTEEQALKLLGKETS